MSAHLSVQYLLCGISDCIYKLFPGDRTAFESVDFIQSRQLLLLIPLILILPLFMGLDGILYSAPIADVASAVIVAFFIVPEMKKLNRNLVETA